MAEWFKDIYHLNHRKRQSNWTIKLISLKNLLHQRRKTILNLRLKTMVFDPISGCKTLLHIFVIIMAAQKNLRYLYSHKQKYVTHKRLRSKGFSALMITTSMWDNKVVFLLNFLTDFQWRPGRWKWTRLIKQATKSILSTSSSIIHRNKQANNSFMEWNCR